MKLIFINVKPGLITIFLTLALITCGSIASAGEIAEILPITPVPKIYLDGSNVPGRIECGQIDRIDGKGVVVGDSFMFFSSSVAFLSASRQPISPSWFKPGTPVGIRLNSENRIVAMWIGTGEKP